MLDYVLRTKLHIPSVRRDIVSRQRLRTALDRGTGINTGFDRPIVLISAPAGFGKTTAIAEWIALWQDAGNTVSWLSLDERDDDPTRLLAHLTMALGELSPGIDPAIIPLLDSGAPPSVTDYLTALINRLVLDERDAILVLDDLHRIESTISMEAIQFLIDNLPPRVCLVLLTREDPPLPLGRIRSSGRLTEIRAANLRFNAVEAGELLNDQMRLDLSPASVDSLDRRTEGWIAGLQMAALSLRGRDKPDEFVDAFAGSHRFVLDYLSEEVIANLAPDTRDFLLRTSVLENLTGPLCDAVTGSDGGATLLGELHRANTFIVSLDETRNWYRYHHLFGEVLRSLLRSRYPDQVAALHVAASAWFEREGMLESALAHAHAAGRVSELAELGERLWESMNSRFQVRTWLHWMMKLPRSEILARPDLAFYCAESLGDLGELEKGNELLDGIEASHSDDTSDSTTMGRIALLRAENYQTGGNLDKAVEFAKRARSLIPEDKPVLSARANLAQSFPSWGRGETEQAEAAIRRWIDDMSHIGAASFALASHLPLAEIMCVRGNLGDAIAELERSIAALESDKENTTIFAAHFYLLIALLLHERNEREKRNSYLDRAQVLSGHDTLADWPYRWNVGRARVLENDWGAALDLLEEAKSLYVRNPVPNARPVGAMIADLHLRRGSIDAAGRWARSYETERTSDPGFLDEYEEMVYAKTCAAESIANASSAARLESAFRRVQIVSRSARNQDRVGSEIEISIVRTVLADLLGRERDAREAAVAALTLAAPERWIRPFLEAPSRFRIYLDAPELGADAARFALLIKDTLLEQSVSDEVQSHRFGLSNRELEVLAALDSDLSGPEIAASLFVSLNTFRTHTKSIFAKIDVNSRLAAVRKAKDRGIIS